MTALPGKQTAVVGARKASPAAVRPSPRFFACVGLLLATAAAMQGIARYGDAFLRKEALPLKQHLYTTDKRVLAPEYELHGRQPPPLDDEIIANLNTDEYLQWNVVDRTLPPSDSASTGLLFVTYNTGKPDMVPHNPRECIASSGWTLVADQLVRMKVTRVDGQQVEIPVALLEFEAPSRGGLTAAKPAHRFVMFFFESNGKFCTTREEVRSALGNPFDKYAYYMKFEMCFVDADFSRLAGRDASLAAGEKLLRKLLPAIWHDHMQDWNAIKQGATPALPKE